MRRAALLLGASLAAGACAAVGPNWRRPDADVPKTWPGAKSDEASLGEWWKSFGDPTLTSLVERALRENLDLAQARARIREARAARAIAEAGLFPQLDVSAEFQRARRSSSGGVAATSSPSGTTTVVAGGGSGITNLFRAGLDAVWEIDVFGGRRRAVEAADADVAASVEDLRDVRVSLAGEVGLAYMELRGFQAQSAVAKESVDAERRAADIARRRHDAGFASGLDAAIADSAAATTAAQIPALDASAAQAIHRLSVLLAREPSALADELSPGKAIPKPAPELPTGLPSDLLRRRPDVRRAEAQLHAANARIGVATADLYPKFSLLGALGWAGPTVSSLGQAGARTWSVGPSATWPLFDAGRARAGVAQAQAAIDETYARWKKTVLVALSEVEDALVAYEKERERHVALETAAERGRAAVDFAQKLYSAGETDALNLVSAQRSLYAAEDSVSQSDRAVAADVVAVYKALGGGW